MTVDAGTRWIHPGTATLPAPSREVMWCLDDDEGAEWPPYPAETIPAVLIAPGLAELTAPPGSPPGSAAATSSR